MTSEQWARVRDVLHRALDRPPEERADWVGAVCEDEPEIRAEVESLLGAYEADDALFETGATGGGPGGVGLGTTDRSVPSG
jgi:hypothetical protein